MNLKEWFKNWNIGSKPLILIDTKISEVIKLSKEKKLNLIMNNTSNNTKKTIIQFFSNVKNKSHFGRNLYLYESIEKIKPQNLSTLYEAIKGAKQPIILFGEAIPKKVENWGFEIINNIEEKPELRFKDIINTFIGGTIKERLDMLNQINPNVNYPKVLNDNIPKVTIDVNKAIDYYDKLSKVDYLFRKCNIKWINEAMAFSIKSHKLNRLNYSKKDLGIMNVSKKLTEKLSKELYLNEEYVKIKIIPLLKLLFTERTSEDCLKLISSLDMVNEDGKFKSDMKKFVNENRLRVLKSTYNGREEKIIEEKIEIKENRKIFTFGE